MSRDALGILAFALITMTTALKSVAVFSPIKESPLNIGSSEVTDRAATLINRDLSLIEFFRRVLEEAQDQS